MTLLLSVFVTYDDYFFLENTNFAKKLENQWKLEVASAITGGVVITAETVWTITPESLGTITPITPKKFMLKNRYNTNHPKPFHQKTIWTQLSSQVVIVFSNYFRLPLNTPNFLGSNLSAKTDLFKNPKKVIGVITTPFCSRNKGENLEILKANLPGGSLKPLTERPVRQREVITYFPVGSIFVSLSLLTSKIKILYLS